MGNGLSCACRDRKTRRKPLCHSAICLRHVTPSSCSLSQHFNLTGKPTQTLVSPFFFLLTITGMRTTSTRASTRRKMNMFVFMLFHRIRSLASFVLRLNVLASFRIVSLLSSKVSKFSWFCSPKKTTKGKERVRESKKMQTAGATRPLYFEVRELVAVTYLQSCLYVALHKTLHLIHLQCHARNFVFPSGIFIFFHHAFQKRSRNLCYTPTFPHPKFFFKLLLEFRSCL